MSVILRLRAASLALCATIAVVLSGCGPRRELREWTPADHQTAPPGSGVPEEPGEEDEDEGPSAAGAALFAVHCATCHGMGGRGDGPGAPPMARVPDLTSPELAARRTDADVEALIAAGRGFMPGFERSIPAEGIHAVAEYVRTMAPMAAVAPAEPAEPGDAPAPGDAVPEAPASGDAVPEAPAPEAPAPEEP